MSTLNQTTHFNVWSHSLFTESDIINFKNGVHHSLYKHFGSHFLNLNGQAGTYFSVWAPNATAVSVVGNFNEWNEKSTPLKKLKNVFKRIRSSLERS